MTHRHTLDSQSSLYGVFSSRPSSTDIIPPHDKPTTFNLQTLPDWNFLLQMLKASITSWSDSTKSAMRTCAHSCVPRTLSKGSSARHRSRTSKDGQFEQRFIHNKCHHGWQVTVTLVGFTNSEVQHVWLKRPRQLNAVCLISINSFRKDIITLFPQYSSFQTTVALLRDYVFIAT